MSNNIINLTDANFDKEITTATKPVLVDFWAQWCGPCKLIAPVLEEIAQDYTDKLLVCKLNIDEQPLTAPKFGIRGIPTLLLFKEGKLVDTHVGNISKAHLSAFLDKHL